ncbi:MAG: hypothetical protein WC365_08910 [Candidatus Babeliales bacterium]
MTNSNDFGSVTRIPVREGHCPICDSQNIGHGEEQYYNEDEGVSPSAIETEIHCDDCGADFIQTDVFTRTFCTYLIESKDGQDSISLCEGDIYDPDDLKEGE